VESERYGSAASAVADSASLRVGDGAGRLLLSRCHGRHETLDAAQRRTCARHLLEDDHDQEIDRLLSATTAGACTLLQHGDRFELVHVLVEQQRGTQRESVQSGAELAGWWQPDASPEPPRLSALEAHAYELPRLVASCATTALCLGMLRTAWRTHGSVRPQASQLRYFDVTGEAGRMVLVAHAYATWHQGAIHAVGLCGLQVAWKLADLTATYQLNAARGMSWAAPDRGRRTCPATWVASGLPCALSAAPA
jgi:hypothetical protein